MRRVLISGAGIAGLTLGYWLLRRGWKPTIVELAPSVRGGGYMIDFWGAGFDVAEKMGILSKLENEHCEIPAVEFVDRRNRVGARLEVRRLREMMGWRHFNLLRSGLERVLYEKVEDQLEIRFSTSIEAIRQGNEIVEVELSDKKTEEYDLVVGADGLRSRTRRLVFGPDDQFERYLGYYTASFTLANYTGRSDVFRSFTAPGRQAGIYSVPGGKLATFFIFKERTRFGHLVREVRKEKLRAAFAGLDWEIPRLLEAIDESEDFYFDAVSQIEMPDWSRCRVSLVGDACQCVSLIAGQGAGLAMAGAYLLADELTKGDRDHRLALACYEANMKREIVRKQRMAQRFAASFVPSSRVGILFRDLFMKLMVVRPVAKYFIERFISDELRLAED